MRKGIPNQVLSDSSTSALRDGFIKGYLSAFGIWVKIPWVRKRLTAQAEEKAKMFMIMIFQFNNTDKSESE